MESRYIHVVHLILPSLPYFLKATLAILGAMTHGNRIRIQMETSFRNRYTSVWDTHLRTRRIPLRIYLTYYVQKWERSETTREEASKGRKMHNSYSKQHIPSTTYIYDSARSKAYLTFIRYFCAISNKNTWYSENTTFIRITFSTQRTWAPAVKKNTTHNVFVYTRLYEKNTGSMEKKSHT